MFPTLTGFEKDLNNPVINRSVIIAFRKINFFINLNL